MLYKASLASCINMASELVRMCPTWRSHMRVRKTMQDFSAYTVGIRSTQMGRPVSDFLQINIFWTFHIIFVLWGFFWRLSLCSSDFPGTMYLRLASNSQRSSSFSDLPHKPGIKDMATMCKCNFYSPVVTVLFEVYCLPPSSTLGPVLESYNLHTI